MAKKEPIESSDIELMAKAQCFAVPFTHEASVGIGPPVFVGSNTLKYRFNLRAGRDIECFEWRERRGQPVLKRISAPVEFRNMGRWSRAWRRSYKCELVVVAGISLHGSKTGKPPVVAAMS